jgi:hypothetical protein
MLRASANPPTYTDIAMKIEAPVPGIARAQSLSWCRLLGLGVTVVALLGGRAMAAPKRLGVVPFSGPAGSAVEKAATKAIAAHKYKIVELADGPAPDPGPGEDQAARTAAASEKLVGILSGVVVAKRKTLTATIYLRQGEEGDVIAQRSWSGKSAALLAKAVKKGAWSTFGEALAPLRAPRNAPPPSEDAPVAVKQTRPEAPAAPPPPPPPAPTPSVVENPPVLDQEPPPRPAPAPKKRRAQADELDVPSVAESGSTPATGPMPIELVVGPRLTTRSLSYINVPDKPLGEFHTDRPSAALGLGATWFPRLGLPRLGVTADVQYGAKLSASTAAGDTYNLTSNEFTGGVIVGVPTRWVTFDAVVGGGLHDSSISPVGEAPASPIPGISYKFVRAGGQIHVYTPSPFSIGAGLGYRYVLSSGEISSADWFPSLDVYGLDGNVAASYRITPWLEARLEGDVRSYRFHMHTNVGDPHVAGGATDRYWGAMLGIAGLFGG